MEPSNSNKKFHIERLYNLMLKRQPSTEEYEVHLANNHDLEFVQRYIAVSEEFNRQFYSEFDAQQRIRINFPIYIINLERRPDRKKNIEQSMQRCGIFDYEFINAIDGKEKNYESYYDDAKAQMLNRRLSNLEIASALSHQIAYRKIIEENIPFALIFEDDAIPTKNLNKFLTEIHRFKLNMDLLFLGCFSSNSWYNGKLKEHQSEEYLIEKYSICYLSSPVQKVGDISIHNFSYPSLELDFINGGHAYIITNSGAKKLLDLNTPIWCEIDNIWNYITDEINIQSTLPLLVYRQVEDSDVTFSRRKHQKVCVGEKYEKKSQHIHFGK